MSFLSEYLVRLGFSTDMVGYSKYEATLRDASTLVHVHTENIAKDLLTWQTAANGLFASVGAGVLGMVDKVIMGDQEFRMLALRMYTTTHTARELKMSMDALGQPLENIAWDPELYRRFQQLIKDQENMSRGLGPNFEQQMVQLRDYRFELTRLGVESQYLAMNLVKDLGKAFGFDLDKKFGDLKSFNDWLTTHLPEAANWVATRLVPVLRDVRDVAGETIDLFRGMGTAFTNMVGVISGDRSLQTSAANFDQFSKAVIHALGWVKDFVDGIIRAEEAALHVVNAGAALKNRDFAAMSAELAKARESLTPASGAIAGAVIGSLVPGAGTLAGAAIGGSLGLLGGTASAYAGLSKQSQMDLGQQQAANKLLIIAMARRMGVPPELALAVANHESNFEQWDQSGGLLTNLGTKDVPSHAMGLFQLQPGTARQMGVDPTTAAGNVEGGVKFLRYLLNKFNGDEIKALSGYYGHPDASKNLAFAQDIMRRQRGFQGQAGPVTIHNTYQVNVKVDRAGASADEIATATEKKMREIQDNRTQKNLAEFSAQGTSY